METIIPTEISQQMQVKVSPKILRNTINTEQDINITNSNSHLSMLSNAEHSEQILTGSRLNSLIREVDPSIQLDENVDESLMNLTEDFVDHLINGAFLIAKHRHVKSVEVKDIQIYLERVYNMWIPGFGTDELKPYRRSSLIEPHKQRLALIRRCFRKN